MAGFNFFSTPEHQWSDLQVVVGGSIITRITGIKLALSAQVDHIMAAGKLPVGVQSGNQMPSGSITLLKTAFDAMNTAAQVAGGNSILDLEFDLNILFLPKGLTGLQTNTMFGVRIEGFDLSVMQGATSITVELPFKATRLVIA